MRENWERIQDEERARKGKESCPDFGKECYELDCYSSLKCPKCVFKNGQ